MHHTNRAKTPRAVCHFVRNGSGVKQAIPQSNFVQSLLHVRWQRCRTRGGWWWPTHHVKSSRFISFSAYVFLFSLVLADAVFPVNATRVRNVVLIPHIQAGVCSGRPEFPAITFPECRSGMPSPRYSIYSVTAWTANRAHSPALI
jgi:hypothetical protein